MNKKSMISILIAILLIQQISVAQQNTENDKLPLSAKSAILLDASTGRVLYSTNNGEKLPMASTTKIMTALVALDKGNLDKRVTINKDSVGIEGSSIYLCEKERLTLRDLLYGLMLRSGNDAATAIAIEIGGSLEKFSQMMNEKAKEIGALNSNFTNPHGLHDDNHYTTAYDLAIITREALKYKDFQEISKAKNWTADREVNNYFLNKNKTLWQYDGGDGIKTGFTKAAGRCLVTSATRNGMQLIAVVLNDGNWFNDCYSLMDFGFDSYKPFVIYSKNQFIKNIDVYDGTKNNVALVTKDELIFPLKENEKDRLKLVVKLDKQSVKAPVKRNDVMGNLQVYLDGELMAKTDLLTNINVKEKSRYLKMKDTLKKIVK